MGFGDRARDEQAEPGTGPAQAALRAAELLEDDAVLLARDSGTAVAHTDRHAAVRAPHLDVDRLAALRPLHGVLDQIRQDLTQTHAVAAHLRDRPVHDRVDRHLVLAESRRSHGFLGELAHVDVVEVIGERARLDARRVEHVRDEVGETGRLVRDQGQERGALVRRQLAPALLQRPRGADHGRHRAPQLVRDERDEVCSQRGEAAKLLDRAVLGVVRTNVLNGGRREPADERGELHLFRAEGVDLAAGERQQPDRRRADQQRRREP